MQPLQQPVEGGEPGPPPKDAVEPRPQCRSPTPIRLAPIGFQIGVVPPDQSAQELLGGVLPVGEGVESVQQPLGMHPAQSVAIGGSPLVAVVETTGPGRQQGQPAQLTLQRAAR